MFIINEVDIAVVIVKLSVLYDTEIIIEIVFFDVIVKFTIKNCELFLI